jgi:2-amino-4-hydroxy-6-hydroxymethyldihydropteridine diphosphokinase
MNKKIYLGLGTNVGDRLQQLQGAIQCLHHTAGIDVTRRSSIYQTAPIGYRDQPDFYNMVIEIESVLTPMQLLTTILHIEQKYHRVREVRWGPRTMDIDILLYGSHCIQSDDLQIPHPRMKGRAFVLIPLYELVGNQVLPGTDHTLQEWIAWLSPKQKIRIMRQI